MNHDTRSQRLVALILAFGAGTYGSATGAETALTELIPASPYQNIIPPPEPEKSTGGYRVQGGGEFIDLGTKLWSQREVKAKFQEELNIGLVDARKSGQQGVLLNVQYAENRDSVDRWTPGGPVAGGVTVVGIGPNPGAVCFINRCDRPAGETLNPTAARRYTTDSDYYWVGKAKEGKGRSGEYVIARFKREPMQRWTTQVALTENASKALALAANIQIVDGLAQKVQEEAKTARSRTEIDRILASRDKAKKELARVDSELAVELKRQDERARTMETLKVMGWALSAASIANTERVAQINATSSTPSLEQQLKAGNIRIEELRARSAQWTDQLDGTTKFLFDRTIQYSVPIPRMAPTDNKVVP